MVHFSTDRVTTACGVYALGKHSDNIAEVTCPKCKAAQQSVKRTAFSREPAG